MSIRRTRLAFEDHFTQIPNAWLRDSRVSMRARGLLAQLLSHRENWEVTLESLVRDNPEGRDAIRTAVDELTRAGYLVVRRRRDEDTGRYMGTDYDLSDPFAGGADFPASGEPTEAEPASVNRGTKNTNSQEDQSPEDRKRTQSARANEGGEQRAATEKQLSFLRDIASALPDSEITGALDAGLTAADADALIRESWGEIEQARASAAFDADDLTPRMRDYLAAASA